MRKDSKQLPDRVEEAQDRGFNPKAKVVEEVTR
jgi:hypothetical protein